MLEQQKNLFGVFIFTIASMVFCMLQLSILFLALST